MDEELSAVLKSIGQELKDARTARGLSQKVVSVRTGIAQKTISRIEHGIDKTKVSTIMKIAEAVGMKLQLVNDDTYEERYKRKDEDIQEED